MYFWVEKYLYKQRDILQWIISFALLPFSVIWMMIGYAKYFFTKQVDHNIACISVGNLTIGGSGKTPVTIELAKRLSKPAIILRGYGRKSKGLIVVSNFGIINCNVLLSGDEAMLYATKVPNALVIVSENRVQAINTAKNMGANVILLDDAFGKFNIKKLNILLKPKNHFVPFCIPSGPYRFAPFMEKYADIIMNENIEFKRHVSINTQATKMLLVTSIANPSRLDDFLPQDCIVDRLLFEDHSYMDLELIREKFINSNADAILITQKDAVKLENLDLPKVVINLDIELSSAFLMQIDTYLSTFHLHLDKITAIK